MALIRINTHQNPVILDTAWFQTGAATTTLAQAYNNGAAAADQTLNIAAANGGQLTIQGAAAGAQNPLFLVQDVNGGNQLLNIGQTSLTRLASAIADGAVSAIVLDTANALANASANVLSLRNAGVEKLAIRFNGNLVHAATLTNTDNMVITTNVADGASSVGLAINNGIALANATAKLLSLRNNGTENVYAKQNGEMFVAGGNGYTVPNGAGIGIFNQAGTRGIEIDIGGNAAAIFGGNLIPQADRTAQSGAVTTRWTASWSQQYMGMTQTVAFSATPALNPTSGGETILNGPVTGNITGATMTSGSPGQRATIHFLKDGTANTYTIAFSGANVRAQTGIAFTAATNSIVRVSFVWDDQLATPAWVQDGAFQAGL